MWLDFCYTKEIFMQMLKKERSSNIELFRIITMIIIVAYHYVVNSNLINIIEAKSYINAQDIFILLFGWKDRN